jgi:hypothetical protein
MSSGINLPLNVTVGTTPISNGTNNTLLTNEGGVVGDTDYTVPKTDGTAGQVLQTNGAGVVSFQTIATGITVGTTAVTSGTDGRVFFQAGGVVQQDGAFNWDNTNKRLGIGANATSPTSALNIRTNVATANDILTIQNGFYGNTLFRIRDNAGASANLMGSVYCSSLIYGGDSGVTRRFDLGGFGLGASFGDFGSNAVWENNQGNVGDGQGTSVIAVSSNFYVNLQTTKKYKFEAVTGNFGIGNVGTLGARLDVRAQGILSTDIAFRVRNNNDSADIFSIRGNGEMYIPQAQFNNQNIIYIAGTTDSIIRYSPTAIGSIAFGQGASITNATYYNTAIGNGATAGASAGFGISIGFNTLVNSVGGIAIGDRARTSGTDTIVIGNTGGSTTYSGTRSIYLGKKGNNGNNFGSDDVFMTHFNSDNSSTLIRANGSLGLLGQQAYIFTNGTGTFGTDTFMGNGGNTLVVRNHPNIPSTNITDSFQQYSADITTGNAAPHFRTENGSIIKLYQETTGVAAATLVSNAGTALTSTDTFDGYTMQQIVKALRNLGILA